MCIIFSDLLAQWRSLEVDIINLIASRLSSSKSTTTTAFSSDDSGHSQGTSVSWSPTSANSSNILAETAGRQRHSFQHQQQQHEERTYARDMRDSGIIIDDDGCNFLSVVEENAATGDRRLYHISADATLVDEMLTNRNNSSLVNCITTEMLPIEVLLLKICKSLTFNPVNSQRYSA
jgi:hypothetical protein